MSGAEFLPSTIEQLNSMDQLQTSHAILGLLILSIFSLFAGLAFMHIFKFLVWFLPKFYERLKS